MRIFVRQIIVGIVTIAMMNLFVPSSFVFAIDADDTTPPIVSAISPTTATVGSATAFSASYSDAVGVTSCSLYIGTNIAGSMTIGSSGISGTATHSYTPTASGSYQFFVGCSDAAGNVGYSSAETTVIVSEESAPEPQTIAPPPTEPQTIAPPPTRLPPSYGAVPPQITPGGDSSAETTVIVSEESSSSTADPTVTTTDTTVPTVSAVTPTTATQDTATSFVVTATDVSSIDECRLVVNGNDYGAMTAGSSNQFSRSYTPTSTNSLAVYATCTDTAGNATSGTSVTVSVSAATTTTTADTVAPTVSALSPKTVTAGELTTLQAKVDDRGGVDSCVLYVNSALQGTMTNENGYATYRYQFSDPGTAIANAYCIDTAGNATRGASTTITITEGLTVEELSAVSSAEDRSLLKLACGSMSEVTDPCHAVYYYDGSTRHAFPNEKVFFTWYTSFDDVVVVTDEFMASLALGGNVTYRPGSMMVKFVSMNTVYVVGEEGELRAVSSEDTAQDLYGEQWNEYIHDISDAFYSNYTFGDDLANASDYDPETVRNSVTFIEEIL